MENRTDQDMAGFFGVEDMMRLKAKAAMVCRELVGKLTDARKIREQVEGVFQAAW
jgi:hypothetical protein